MIEVKTECKAAEEWEIDVVTTLVIVVGNVIVVIELQRAKLLSTD
jgi:hypothetical protein